MIRAALRSVPVAGTLLVAVLLAPAAPLDAQSKPGAAAKKAREPILVAVHSLTGETGTRTDLRPVPQRIILIASFASGQIAFSAA